MAIKDRTREREIRGGVGIFHLKLLQKTSIISHGKKKDNSILSQSDKSSKDK